MWLHIMPIEYHIVSLLPSNFSLPIEILRLFAIKMRHLLWGSYFQRMCLQKSDIRSIYRTHFFRYQGTLALIDNQINRIFLIFCELSSILVNQKVPTQWYAFYNLHFLEIHYCPDWLRIPCSNFSNL